MESNFSFSVPHAPPLKCLAIWQCFSGLLRYTQPFDKSHPSEEAGGRSVLQDMAEKFSDLENLVPVTHGEQCGLLYVCLSVLGTAWQQLKPKMEFFLHALDVHFFPSYLKIFYLRGRHRVRGRVFSAGPLLMCLEMARTGLKIRITNPIHK